jgi:NAD(P)-dependent dehydrogenase (short-subunit alcohol dehydrogenase family)
MNASPLKDSLSLRGKRAVVTGSSQGIGRAIALGLAEFGADVLVHCASQAEKAEAVRLEIEQFGVRSGVVVADLAEAEAAGKIASAAEKAFGGVDILVLNASIQFRKPWHEILMEDYRRQVDVNFGSCLWLLQALLPPMGERGWGRVLTVGSVQQLRPHPEMLVYSATKAALSNMVRSLAPQWAGRGVTINNLAPGAIATARNIPALSDETYRRKVVSNIPAGFIGEPVDCAGMALLLCSDAGRYITGQDLFVDGGLGLP